MNPPIRKPPRIRTGDVVAVVAPSGVLRRERLEAGARVLEDWGLRLKLGGAVLARHGYLAGGDDARLADLEGVLADPEVRAVFCARGGYGSQRLLPRADLSVLARAPKAIVGYSDATALLNAVVGTGTVAVHGPMVADDMARGLSARSMTHLRTLLMDPDYLWEAEVPLAIRPGEATGPLVGGCLSVLVATLGTPWALDPTGAVLLLEDVRERPYRLDRMLTQMRQAGLFDRVAGIVFGTMAACPTVDGVGPLDVIRACVGDLPVPIGFGLAAGHAPEGPGVEHVALPLGVRVSLDTGGGRLRALEPAVV